MAASPVLADSSFYIRLLREHQQAPEARQGFTGLSRQVAALADAVQDGTEITRGAAALGALAWEREIRRDRRHLTLVQRLPVPPLAAVQTAGEGRTTVPLALRPTHLVHASRAYALRGRPLTLGSGPPPGARGLVLGGVLTEASWRWVFFVPVLMSLAILVAGIQLVPGSRRPTRRAAGFDVAGATTVTVSVPRRAPR